MTTQRVLSEGSAACAVLERLISGLKDHQPIVETGLSGFVAECQHLISEVKAHPELEYIALNRALQICGDFLKVITADYRQTAAGLREKLDKYT